MWDGWVGGLILFIIGLILGVLICHAHVFGA